MPKVLDVFADPKFVKLPADPAAEFDVRLKKDSPAVDAGVSVPEEWFDPLRADDAAARDIGVLPLGQGGWLAKPEWEPPADE